MSRCIKDLYDYELVKKCSKCGIISLKSSFEIRSISSDGFHPQCKFCIKEFYVDNKNRLLNKQNLYNEQNRHIIKTRLKEYFKDRKESDINFKLASYTRNWFYKAYKAQNVMKTNKNFDSLGRSSGFFKKWILHQLYGKIW